MSKYSNLPDIDKGVDVFETPDEVEEPLRPSDDLVAEDDAPTQASTSEAIDGSKLPERKRVEKVFRKGARRRDGLKQYRPRRADHDSDSESSRSDSDTFRETPTARLQRLKREIAELESQVRTNAEAGPSNPNLPSKEKKPTRKSVIPPKPPIDLMNEIGGLRERISLVEVHEDHETLGMDSEGAAGWKERIAELGKSGSQAKGAPNGGIQNGAGTAKEDLLPSAGGSAGVGELDKRLAALEELIGPLGEGSDQTSAPLLDTVSKLDHLLLVLTQPRHLDAISRRIKLLLVDLDRAATAARRAPATSNTTQTPSSSVTLSSQEYNTLQSLFAILPRLDPILPIVPPLLARLKSLAALHAQARDVADGLKRLEKEDKRSMEEVKDLSQVVEEVRKGIEDGATGISRNWEALNARLESLEGRLKKL